MAKNKKNVIWIEDNPESEIHKDLSKLLKRKGMDLFQVKNVDKLAVKLGEIESSSICGFIVDMMLSGPNNLSSFKKPGVEWDDDADAGDFILEHVLKNNDSAYIEIPTVVLSVRSDIDETKIKLYKKTEFVQKRDPLDSTWFQELKKWVQELQ